MEKIFKISWPDDYGPEWLCLNNLNLVLRSKEFIGEAVPLIVEEFSREPEDSAGKKKRRPCGIPHDRLYYGTKCPECGR